MTSSASRSSDPSPAIRPAATDARAAARGDEVVMVVDVRDPRTGGPAMATNAQVGRVDAAVREAHAVVSAHGGRTVALLGTRLVGAFPDGSVEAGLDAAVDLQQRSAAPAASWACSIGLATGPDNHQVDSASLGIALVGGAVDRALLLAAWSAAGSVVADDRTIASAHHGASSADPAPGAAPAAEARGTGTPAAGRWALGASHVLVGHEREPVEYWELTFPRAHDGVEAGVGDAAAAAPVAPVDRRPAPSRAGVRERLDALDPARPLAASVPAASAVDVRITTTRVAARTDSGTTDPTGAGTRTRPVARPGTRNPAERPAGRAPRTWSRGEVRCWFPNRGRGVIGSSTTQEFYVDRRFLAVPSTIDAGDSVYFVPRDAVGGGRNPAASAVLVVGAEVEVRVDEVDERGFGVSELKDPAGTRALLLLDLAGARGAVAVEPGDWLLVRIRASDHGPVGEPL